MFPPPALLALACAHPQHLVETNRVAAHAGDANVRTADLRSGE